MPIFFAKRTHFFINQSVDIATYFINLSCSLHSASEMTYIVSSRALNSTHSLAAYIKKLHFVRLL